MLTPEQINNYWDKHRTYAIAMDVEDFRKAVTEIETSIRKEYEPYKKSYDNYKDYIAYSDLELVELINQIQEQYG